MSQKLLVSVHSQEGYGRGVGEEQISQRVEEFDGHTMLLKDHDRGEVYGEEETYDIIIEGDQLYGMLNEDVANAANQVYDEIEIIGMYGSECVANAAESFEGPEVSINSEATVDQIFGSGNFVVSDLLERGSTEAVNRYVEGFRNKDTAMKVVHEGESIEKYLEQPSGPSATQVPELNAVEGEDAVIIT